MGILSADQTAPARNWKAIVLDAPLSGCRAIYVGGDGDLSLTGDDGNTEVFSGLLAGMVLPCSPRMVTTANTTATLLIGLY